MFLSRRAVLAGVVAVPAAALAQHEVHRGLFSNLKDPGAKGPPYGMEAQRYFHSSAPSAGGRGSDHARPQKRRGSAHATSDVRSASGPVFPRHGPTDRRRSPAGSGLHRSSSAA